MVFAQYFTTQKKAGERVGAVSGCRLGSQRPEIPAAQGLFGLRDLPKYGAVFEWFVLSTVPQMRNFLLFTRNLRC